MDTPMYDVAGGAPVLGLADAIDDARHRNSDKEVFRCYAAFLVLVDGTIR